MAFFEFVKVGGVRGKGMLSRYVERFWTQKSYICRFYVAVCLFSNRSQMTWKCGKSKKVAHEAIAECVTDALTTFWRLQWSIIFFIFISTLQYTTKKLVCLRPQIAKANRGERSKNWSTSTEQTHGRRRCLWPYGGSITTAEIFF